MKKKLLAAIFVGTTLSLAACGNKEAVKAIETQAVSQTGAVAETVAETETEIAEIETSTPEEMVTIYVKKSMTFYNNDGSTEYQRAYEYDDQGNVIKSARTNADGSLWGTITYTYDDDGRILVQHEELADGRLRSHGEYTYDENGFLEKATWYDKDHKVMSWNEYVVDENGRKLEYLHYDSEGKLWDHILYVWDGDRLMSLDNVNDAGNVTWRYSYQYDEDGNCIQEFSGKPGNTEGNRYDFYYENGLRTGWDYGNSEGRSTYGEYEYMEIEVSEEAAERYYKNIAENPGDL